MLGVEENPVTAPFGAMLQTWPGPVPAPGASKVVCADIEMEIARATRMVAAGWSFLFAKSNGFMLLNAITTWKTAHSFAKFFLL